MSIYEKAQNLEKWLINIRREIHSKPELDFDLPITTSLVERELNSIGLKTKRVGGGVLSSIGNGKHTIVIRADMDALPIEETPGRSYGSTFKGRMHACGHDAHTACLIGAARVLKDKMTQDDGSVLFVFQPAEETSGGAMPMIEEGILDDKKIKAALALHCDPSIEIGKIGINPGKARAASDMFNIRIKGKSSHGAEPQRGIDAIAIACQTVTAMQQIVSRRSNPVDPSVMTVGTFHSGKARNIISGEAYLEGILRTTDRESRLRLREELKRIALEMPRTMGATSCFELIEGYPPLINDKNISKVVAESVRTILGREAVISLTAPSMGVDDFSYFSERIPSCYFMLGTGNSSTGKDYPLHNEKFDIDEKALAIGVAILAETTMKLLK